MARAEYGSFEWIAQRARETGESMLSIEERLYEEEMLQRESDRAATEREHAPLCDIYDCDGYECDVASMYN